MKRLPIIGVIGSHIDSHERLSAPLGQLIARRGYHLLTGGGDGIMTAVAKSFTRTAERKGLCIGIIPIEERTELKQLHHYTNPYIELPIITRLNERAVQGTPIPLAHSEVNILTSDVIVVLPGLKGTQSETSLALVCSKPVVLFGHSEDFGQFPDTPVLAETIEQIDGFITQHLASRHAPSNPAASSS